MSIAVAVAVSSAGGIASLAAALARCTRRVVRTDARTALSFVRYTCRPRLRAATPLPVSSSSLSTSAPRGTAPPGLHTGTMAASKRCFVRRNSGRPAPTREQVGRPLKSWRAVDASGRRGLDFYLSDEMPSHLYYDREIFAASKSSSSWADPSSDYRVA